MQVEERFLIIRDGTEKISSDAFSSSMGHDLQKQEVLCTVEEVLI